MFVYPFLYHDYPITIPIIYRGFPMKSHDLSLDFLFLVIFQDGIDMVYGIMGHWFNAASNTLAFTRCSKVKADGPDGLELGCIKYAGYEPLKQWNSP